MAIDKIIDRAATISVSSTDVSDDSNTSTGALDIPVGTTAQRPGSPTEGNIRYNTDLETTEIYAEGAWGRVSPLTPVISSITGNIYNTSANNLTLLGSNFLSTNLVVSFTPSGGSASTVTVTPNSDISATVAVPSAIYGQSAGTVISISVTNRDNRTSAATNKTVLDPPTGGTVTTSGNFRIHTFNSSANFVVPSSVTLADVEYLVIAGGGSGGDYGGGGGAGGYRSSVVGENSGGGASAESRITMAPATYACTIGAGGAADTTDGTYDSGNSGVNSSIIGGSISIASVGGGLGGPYNNVNGSSGGSGGGAGIAEVTGSAVGGSGTSGQGYAGGSNTVGRGGSGTYPGGAGGGGAGAVGFNGSAKGAAGQPGGAGVASSITGSSITRAGGGGGASGSSGIGGAGGAGGGGTAEGYGGADKNGGTNTGGGGGSHIGTASNTISGNGGSGVVIIRYQLP